MVNMVNKANPIRLPAPGVSRSTASGPRTGPYGRYDAVSPNPSGREVADYSTKEPVATLLRCKRPMNIATMNTRTIRELKG